MAGMCTESGGLLSRARSEGGQDDRAKGGSAPRHLLRVGKGEDWSLLGLPPHKGNNLRLNWKRGRCGRLSRGQPCGSLWWRRCSASWLEEDVRLRSRQAGRGGRRGERRVGDKVRLGRSRVGMLNNKSVLRRRSKGLESWS